MFSAASRTPHRAPEPGYGISDMTAEFVPDSPLEEGVTSELVF
jgi:hypothetical protein